VLKIDSEEIINPHNVADRIPLLLIAQKTLNYVADFQGTSATMPNGLVKSVSTVVKEELKKKLTPLNSLQSC
jgi:ribosomal protein S4E